MELKGLHHVTAVTGNPSLNVGFYTEVLGLRLVKKTVNQDDVGAYHLFYADEAGHAGTDMTFFDWPHVGKRAHGAGTITATSFRVPGKALEFWARRLRDFGITHSGIVDYTGRRAIAFLDPEGQSLELIDDEGRPGGTPWSAAPVPPEMGITGLGAVRFPVQSLEPTARFLTGRMGFRQAREYKTPDGFLAVVYDVGPGGPGAEVHLEHRPGAAFGRAGIGGVHHVAFRTPADDEHKGWQKQLESSGVAVTPVIDRFYFKSIYFREPTGVLFEIATDGPGFASDEPLEHLGEGLALPPFLEPHRSRIEAGLKPISPMKMPLTASP
jgi:glyoxalase family protein